MIGLINCFLFPVVLTGLFKQPQQPLAHQQFDLSYTYIHPTQNDARSACPMLNTLANHGIISRDGRAIHRNTIVEVFDRYLNIDKSLANFFLDNLFNLNMGTNNSTEIFALDGINEHNKIEHDISLVRPDEYFGDPRVVNPLMVSQMTLFVDQNSYMGISEMAQFRKTRFLESQANPNLTYGFNQQVAALGEAALFLSIFGDSDLRVGKEAILVFLGNESFPKSFQRPQNRITKFGIFSVIAKIRFQGGR